LRLQELEAPNILTLVRIAISPVFLIFFEIHTLAAYLLCLFIAIIIELTDLFDGIIARKNNQITDFGKLMDPFADSISRFSIFMSFLSAGLAPLWMIAIFFYRDVLVSVIRVFAMKEGVVVAARKSGKTKAWAQAICTFVILILLILQKAAILPMSLAEPTVFRKVSTAIIAVTSLVTLWSAYDYFSANKMMIYIAMKKK
jgi:CDP-diacylglycerol--glycerol-3-phosphate 3-phosphatidyltransferase